MTRNDARRMFGVTARQWIRWVGNGTVSCGVTVHSPVGGRRSIYPVEALKRLREELYRRDYLYNNAGGNFAVPAGWARRREACSMFGVARATWDGWARQGVLPRGERFDGGPMLYRIEDLKGVLRDLGFLAPPYPDPDRAGAYRVPLCGGAGRDAGGREAIIDADALPLLDGAALSCETVDAGGRAEAVFVALRRPNAPRGVAVRRVLLNVTDGDLHVGHVNGDPLDCRRANLFARTIQQRTHGARKMGSRNGRAYSSRYKGVCFEQWTQKWRANIVVDGRRRSLGRYGDEVAAAQAYDEAARRWFGAYAWLNFPDTPRASDAAAERDAA